MRFVVIGTQRSGTTYLRQCLDSHPQVRCRGELFARSYGKSEGYQAYRHGSVLRQLGHYLRRTAQVEDFLRERFANREIGEQAVGFKLMRSHVRRVPYLYPMLLPILRRDGYRVIHVVRRNLLRVLVSRRTALARGQFHARTAVPTIEITLPVERLSDELATLAEENRFWIEACAGMSRCEVEYEAFIADQRGESQRLLHFLGVDPEVDLSSPHRRVNRAPLGRIVKNYEEVREVLADTIYAEFVDE